MSEKHLKPYQYYSDLYDRQTIETARRVEKTEGKDIAKYKMDENESDEVTLKNMSAGSQMFLYFENGERYRNKSARIQEWMNRDEKRDRFYESATPPTNIPCLVCGREMSVSSKIFDLGWDKKPDRVLFFYDCILNHVPRRGFYDDGEEYRSKPDECPKCKSDMGERIAKRESPEELVTECICPKCGHVEKSVFDLREKPKEEPVPDPDYAKDRERFCLSDEEGGKYISWMVNLKELTKIMEKHKEKEDNKEVYDEVAKLKRLKIIDLEELLVPVLEKEGFKKFQLKDPEITRDVIVPFVVHDSVSGREDRVSTTLLNKLIKKTLENTNWRLMTDGTNYRMGMLDGRLRGYEREEDLLKLMKK
jgi:hypothetical protein